MVIVCFVLFKVVSEVQKCQSCAIKHLWTNVWRISAS